MTCKHGQTREHYVGRNQYGAFYCDGKPEKVPGTHTTVESALDFWMVAPFGWGSEENMIRVMKDEAETPEEAIEWCMALKGVQSPYGSSLREELEQHGTDSVLVYDCREVGEFRRIGWEKV